MNTSFQPILQKLRAFRDERNWLQFHDPKNLALAASLEIAELLEHFLWKEKLEIIEYLKDPVNKKEVEHEYADVMAYMLELAEVLDIDIEKAINEKMKLNAKKYPVEKSKNVHTKYSKLK